jgi:hypothetical protein
VFHYLREYVLLISSVAQEQVATSEAINNIIKSLDPIKFLRHPIDIVGQTEFHGLIPPGGFFASFGRLCRRPLYDKSIKILVLLVYEERM